MITRIIGCAVLVIQGLLLPAAGAESPALGRLSFWLAPERHSEFAAAYAREIVPHLDRLGFRPSAKPQRTPVDSAFCRLFEAENPAFWPQAAESLRRSAAFTNTLLALGRRFASTRPDSLLIWQLLPYRSPARPGTQRPIGRAQGVWRNYNPTNSGMAGGKAFFIAQDHDGHMWFPNRTEGISRFDGQAWTTFTAADGLANNFCRYVLVDQQGKVWVGTEGSLSVFDPSAQSWTILPIPTSADSLDPGNAAPRPQRARTIVWSMLEDRTGKIWMNVSPYYDGSELIRYDPHAAPSQRWRSYAAHPSLADGGVSQIFEDNAGHLWFMTDGGPIEYDPTAAGTWRSYGPQDGLPPNIHCIAQDRDGHFWFGSRQEQEGQGLSRYDGTSVRSLRKIDGLLDDIVTALFVDDDGLLWVGGGLTGVSVVDPSTHSVVARYERENYPGIFAGRIPSFFQDREGHIWIGTDGGGASRYDGHTLQVFPDLHGAESIFQDRDGSFWFGTWDEGVLHYSGRTQVLAFTTEHGLPGNGIFSIARDHNGHLWIGSDGGLTRYDGREFTVFSKEDGLGDWRANEILVDGQGDLWCTSANIGAGSGRGVHRLDAAGFVTYTAADGLPADNGVLDIVEDHQGTLWVGGRGGIARFDPATNSWRAYTAADGLPERPVHSITPARDGTYWLATRGGGLSHFTPATSNQKRPRIKNYTVRDGLPGNDLRASIQDRQGHLWFGVMGMGYVRFDGQVFQQLTTQHGILSNWGREILEDRNGAIWIGARSGVTRFQPQAGLKPSVAIRAIAADKRYGGNAAVAIPATVDLVAFEFGGTSLKTQSGDLVYRYRLSGHTDQWQNTRAPRVEYSDLPKGAYTFEVQAVDRDLVYSDLASIGLEVHLPYERYTLVVTLVLALGLVGWQTVRVVRRDRRLVAANRQIEAANRNKSQFLRRMSHDLRAPMNAIIGYTRLLLRRTADRLDEREQRNLKNIETSSNNLLNLINEILDLARIEAGRVELHLQPVDLHQLADECADALESIVQPGVELRRQLAPVDPIQTDPDRLRQVLMNLLSNATKFTDSGHITLSLHPVDQQVEIAVADTGVGIPPQDLPHIFEEFRQVGREGAEAQGTGLGLAIVKKSVELLGGAISVESEVGKGTKFIVRITDCDEKETERA